MRVVGTCDVLQTVLDTRWWTFLTSQDKAAPLLACSLQVRMSAGGGGAKRSQGTNNLTCLQTPACMLRVMKANYQSVSYD